MGMISATQKFERDLEALINASGLPISVVRLALEKITMVAANTENQLMASEDVKTEEE